MSTKPNNTMWDSLETEKLLDMKSKGKSAAAIALELGRSVYAINNKLTRLKEKTEAMKCFEKVAAEREKQEQPNINKIIDFWAKRNKVAKVSCKYVSHRLGLRVKSNIKNGWIK